LKLHERLKYFIKKTKAKRRERSGKKFRKKLEPSRLITALLIGIFTSLGVALVYGALRLFLSECPDKASSQGLCLLIFTHSPWTFLTAMATLPALLLTWYWRTSHRRQEIRVAQDAESNRQFIDAVKLLAEKTAEAILGGIYALEKIAHESRDDHRRVTETLAAFVRQKAPEYEPEEGEPEDVAWDQPEIPKDLRNCIQAALTVLGRRRTDVEEDDPIDLSHCNFKGMRIEKNFRWCSFAGSDLEGADLRQTDLRATDLRKIILEGADLRLAKLDWADLRRANLKRANLSGTNLNDAKLQKADLEDANLWGANLKRAELQQASLKHASLVIADLKGANLAEADLKDIKLGFHIEGTNLEGADFEGTNLEKTVFENVNLRKANFSGADLDGAVLRGNDMTQANFQGANVQVADLKRGKLSSADLRGAYLTRADLEGADLSFSDLTGADLIKANLEGAILYKTTLKGANLQGTIFKGVNLKNLNLDGVDLSKADLNGAILPDGVKVENAGNPEEESE
jgi:uncharacterized protein YjbI with pentapeptide repeats